MTRYEKIKELGKLNPDELAKEISSIEGILHTMCPDHMYGCFYRCNHNHKCQQGTMEEVVKKWLCEAAELQRRVYGNE